MTDFIHQSANLAGVVAGCFTGDLALIGRSLRDCVVEPHRAPLVRGFAEVQRAAMEGGALGCSLSGSGPSLFAWCDGDASADCVRVAMVAAFHRAGVQAEGWICPVDGPGARLESVE
jgi:homoserine kinase